MTVDNQTPGWLSSRINYGDQQTLENLTITGYINSTDLSFIGFLMQKHKLNKSIDLSDAFIVGSTTKNDNDISYDNIFDIQTSVNINLDKLALPKSIVTPIPQSNVVPLRHIRVDTLIYGSDQCTIYNYALWGYWSTSGANSSPKHLILRDGVTTIAAYACDNHIYNGDGGHVRIETVNCPNSMKVIEKGAFSDCNRLCSINLPDNIEEIQSTAFSNSSFTPDTLKLPQSLIIYYTDSFPIKAGQVIELGSNVSEFNNLSWALKKQHKVTFIINRIVPPTFRKGYMYDEWYPSSSDGKELSGCTIYVPKDGYTSYNNSEYDVNGDGSSNPYSYANIKTIPINATEITLNHKSEILNVGSVLNITADIYPTNADNKTIIWN